MYNCLLDGFPDNYKGYKINSDFRVGILLTLLSEDDSIDDDIKILKSLDILYKNKIPDDIEIAINGLTWFLTCGKSEVYYDEPDEYDNTTDKCIDFNLDHLDIWGAFWGRGIDLNKKTPKIDSEGNIVRNKDGKPVYERYKMHWFAFMSAISNLGDCPLSQKISYRTVDLSEMKGETRRIYAKLKDKYKVKRVMDKDEYDEYVDMLEQSYGKYYVKMMGLR